MKKTKKLLAVILSLAIISPAFSSEPQPSYWQRLKNWISGNQTKVQNMVNIPIEWAQTFTAGLTDSQKIALLSALGGFTGAMLGQEHVKTMRRIGNNAELNIALFSGIYSMIGALLAESLTNKYSNAKNLKIAITLIKKDLNDSKKFPTIQSKIDTLKAMQILSGPTGENPNAITLEATNTILNELLNSERNMIKNK